LVDHAVVSRAGDAGQSRRGRVLRLSQAPPAAYRGATGPAGAADGPGRR